MPHLYLHTSLSRFRTLALKRLQHWLQHLEPSSDGAVQAFEPAHLQSQRGAASTLRRFSVCGAATAAPATASAIAIASATASATSGTVTASAAAGASNPSTPAARNLSFSCIYINRHAASGAAAAVMAGTAEARGRRVAWGWGWGWGWGGGWRVALTGMLPWLYLLWLTGMSGSSGS